MEKHQLHSHLSNIRNNSEHLQRLLGDGSGEPRQPPDPAALAKIKRQLIVDIDAIRPELEGS